MGSDTLHLLYDAENRLVDVKKNAVSMATFVYDGDGRRVKSTINSSTTYFVGAHYEVSGSTVTKYYFAGAQRVAMRSGSTLNYLLARPSFASAQDKSRLDQPDHGYQRRACFRDAVQAVG